MHRTVDGADAILSPSRCTKHCECEDFREIRLAAPSGSLENLPIPSSAHCGQGGPVCDVRPAVADLVVPRGWRPAIGGRPGRGRTHRLDGCRPLRTWRHRRKALPPLTVRPLGGLVERWIVSALPAARSRTLPPHLREFAACPGAVPETHARCSARGPAGWLVCTGALVPGPGIRRAAVWPCRERDRFRPGRVRRGSARPLETQLLPDPAGVVRPPSLLRGVTMLDVLHPLDPVDGLSATLCRCRRLP